MELAQLRAITMARSFPNCIYVSIFSLIVSGQSPVLSFPTAFMSARKCTGMFGLLQLLLFIRLTRSPTFARLFCKQFSWPDKRLAWRFDAYVFDDKWSQKFCGNSRFGLQWSI